MTAAMTPAMTTGALWPALLPPSSHGDDDRCLVSAEGVHLTLRDGRRLLCGTSGLWNVNLGYGNEAIAQAVGQALRESSYLGVFRYENTAAREAAAALVEVAGPGHYARVHFSTSGGAANDLVMKLARQYHALRGQPRRRLVVGLRQGFHGLTFGAAALTGDELGQRLYGVDRSLVRHVEINDVEGLEKLMSRSGDQVAAVVVEPMVGTGAVPLDAPFVAALAALREQHGYLLVADEVATGFGRLGRMFASHAWAQQPDVLITSKALTNGTTAAAAVLVTGAVAEPFVAADAVLAHAETQAGTATTAAAVLATIAEVRRLDAVARACRVGAWLERAVDDLVASDPLVAGSSGLGCFRALRLLGTDGRPLPQDQVGAVVDAVRAEGAVVHPGPHGIQLVPALVYTQEQVGELVGCVAAGLARHAAHDAVAGV
jgi:adenosylmethionine-8-amino-7-oxononanoate aminotransferase